MDIKSLPSLIRWSRPGGDWRIDAGIGRYLVAKGSSYSAPIGQAIFQQLKKRIPAGTRRKRVKS